MFAPLDIEMICETCSHPLTKVHNQDYHRCAECNSYRFPTEMESSVDPIVAAGKHVEAECPQCKVALKLGVIHGQWNVCYCENCRGFLMESGSLQVITHVLRATYVGENDTPVPIDPNELTCKRDCPACLGQFDTHPYYGPGNVVIDSCHGCGLTWLDHGELATMMRAPGQRPSPDSSPVVPTYTHVPTDAVAESLAETTKFVIKSALQLASIH